MKTLHLILLIIFIFGNTAFNVFSEYNLAPISKSRLSHKIIKKIPKQIISIVRSFDSFEDMEKWINDIVTLLEYGSSLPTEDLSYLEDLTLLFGLESGPGMDLMDSLGTRIKNHIVKNDLEHIWKVLYNPHQYSTPKFDDIGEVRDKIIIAFNEFNMNNVSVKSRIKQWGSNILKLERVRPKIEGFNRVPYSLSIKEVIYESLQYKDHIADDPNVFFDDLIGFNIEINDEQMDDSQRSSFLTKAIHNVSAVLKTIDKLDITVKRKISAIPEFEAVNIWVQGLLNHTHFGKLPIKIQIRFKKALMWEVVERYMYKVYGKWELPPWAHDIDMNKIQSLNQLQKILFANFKTYTNDIEIKKRYNLKEKLTEPEGFIQFLNWQAFVYSSS